MADEILENQEPVAAEPVTAEPLASEPLASEPEIKRAKGKSRHIPSGIAHIHATFNNTKVTISDMHGNVIAWGTGGRMGYKGSRKSTSYVAQQMGTDVAKRAMTLGMREVEIRMKGPGSGRESAVRGIAAAGLDISVLKDVTPLPHNGCRPPKRRRV